MTGFIPRSDVSESIDIRLEDGVAFQQLDKIEGRANEVAGTAKRAEVEVDKVVQHGTLSIQRVASLIHMGMSQLTRYIDISALGLGAVGEALLMSTISTASTLLSLAGSLSSNPYTLLTAFMVMASYTQVLVEQVQTQKRKESTDRQIARTQASISRLSIGL